MLRGARSDSTVSTTARCDAVGRLDVSRVPWQRGHTSSKSSTVVHGRNGTCDMTKVLETSGADGVVVAGQYVGGLLR